MAVRSLQARLQCNQAQLAQLWLTHSVFHQQLSQTLALLFRMRRGEEGATPELRQLLQTVGHFIVGSDAKVAHYLCNSLCLKNWTPNTALTYPPVTVGDKQIAPTDWAPQMAALSQAGPVVYDKLEVMRGLPGSMKQMLSREAVAVISGHDELVKNWQSNHAEWLQAKDAWEKDPEHPKDRDHQKYLALRPIFEAFETQSGTIGKRRGRWGGYLAWLQQHPELAAWRGGPALIIPLTAEAKSKINKARPNKKNAVEAEAFWALNPELKALDRLHGQYERTFIRRQKQKKHLDGFDHRPTFTQPQAHRHPRWLNFNAPQTNPAGYQHLELPAQPGANGTIELNLITGPDPEQRFTTAWVPLTLRADPRLAAFRRTATQEAKTRYEFYDRHLHRWRLAKISGAKLVMKNIRLNPDGSLRSATPYLVFTCDVADEAQTPAAKDIKWTESVSKTGKRARRIIPEGLVICAVDLGLRHVGFATLGHFTTGTIEILRSRSIHLQAVGAGPDLGRIAAHKRELKTLRRLRGRPVAGEFSHAQLQDHITHMQADRYKKAARALLAFALNTPQQTHNSTGAVFPRADVLVLEKLEGLLPDAAKERGINRALAQWNRGAIVTFIHHLADDLGLKVVEIHPMGTSQVCSRCGALGRRFSYLYDRLHRQNTLRFGEVEKLFACPLCHYLANADHNAAVNLQRKFALGDPAIAAFQAYRIQNEADKIAQKQAIEASLRPWLLQKSAPPLATPF